MQRISGTPVCLGLAGRGKVETGRIRLMASAADDRRRWKAREREKGRGKSEERKAKSEKGNWLLGHTSHTHAPFLI